MKATCGHSGRRECYADGLCWTCHDRARRGLTHGPAFIEEERRQLEANTRAIRQTAIEAGLLQWCGCPRGLHLGSCQERERSL